MLSPAHLALRTTRDLPPDARWQLYEWLSLLNRKLVELAEGRGTGFLIVEAPVRHGKSWLTSINLPAWYLGRHPDRRVIVSGYNNDFAAGFGEAARDLLAEWGPSLFGVKVARNHSAKSDWKLEGHRGGMVTTGTGNPPTGKGAHLMVIDDPIEGPAQAFSPTERENIWRWWQFGMRTRLEPGGVCVIIMSRWHEDDLIGRLLKRQEENPDDGQPVDQWDVLRLPALAEPTEAAPDPLGRSWGDALCPQRYDVDALKKISKAVGPLSWEALFQNRPSLPSGDLLKTHWWRYFQGGLPHGLKLLRRWDMAATAKKLGVQGSKTTSASDPDWCAGALLGIQDGLTYIVDVRRTRGSPKEIEDFIAATAAQDNQLYGLNHGSAGRIPIIMEQEPGSGGVITIDNYRRRVLAGQIFNGKPSVGDKVERAYPFASQLQGENVFLRVAAWTAELVEEARLFPNGTHDDMVDAVVLAYNDLSGNVIESSTYRKGRTR